MPQPPGGQLKLLPLPQTAPQSLMESSLSNGSTTDSTSILRNSLDEALREERQSLNIFLEERHLKLVSCIANRLPQSVHPDISQVMSNSSFRSQALSTCSAKATEFGQSMSNACGKVESCPVQLNGSVLGNLELELSGSAGSDGASSKVLKRSQSVRLAIDSEDQADRLERGGPKGEGNGHVPRVSGEYKSQNSERSIATAATAKSVTTISVVEREHAVRRLHARLGYLAPGNRVTADQIYNAVQTLSLENVKLADIRALVCEIRAASEPDLPAETPSIRGRLAPMASFNQLMKDSLAGSTEATILDSLRGLNSPSVPFHALVDVLIASPETLEAEFGTQVAAQLEVIKDALLSPDADCVVAELMCLRVDDISAPVEPATCLEMMEPFVGGVIMLNGVFIGIQTDAELAEMEIMIVMEVLFSFFFLAELFIKLRITGCGVHFFGEDRYWNWFDFVAVAFAVIDVTISLLPVANDVDTNTITILRLARLTRLTRLVRIFRLQCLKELTLMVKGLLGGLRTLSWAVVLLFFTIYIIGIFLTLMLGQPSSKGSSFEYERDLYFATLPKSMFTTFRCLLIVDCVASDGRPLLTILTNTYGWVVPIMYTFCFIVVSIGLMNLIMAIYIENTLNNAKSVDDRNKAARSRESFRVARQLKRLLVIVCSAQQALSKRTKQSLCTFSEEIAHIVDRRNFSEYERTDLTVEITRETFMLVLQHPTVQKLLDDLDISPERANLFDVLDADSSGHLLPTELVNGLLKCRGETRRGDVVAALLAIRDLQRHVRRMEDVILAGHGHHGSLNRRMSRTLTLQKSQLPALA